ncbi:hypothetical protein cypCar_00046313 [Cyprinus carpio]|nr:hypothetical protein cypCar_00046313 [Cyprinus carpio]
MHNITCAEIQTPVGFLYVILPVILNQTLNPDCEQGWYSELHYSHELMFRVRNETAKIPSSNILNEVTPDLLHSDQLWWFSVLIFIVLAFLCFLMRKRIFRCFQREAWFICQHEDSENRDPQSDEDLI